MSEEKYANAKCFILSPDGYEEITYTELCRRRDKDETYKDKKFIPLHGMLMEVTPEQYIDFYRTRNRQRYLDKERNEPFVEVITEIKNGYVIGTISKDGETADIPPVFVKNDGTTENFFVPEYFEELQKGKVIDIPEKYRFKE